MNNKTLKSPGKLGLYIHIPFCKNKCPYCDFTSYTGKEALQEAYIGSVLKEAAKYREETRTVDSIFIGGGTPSCIKSGLIKKLADGLAEIFHISSDLEFTSEANPNSFSKEKALEFRSAGINRMSFGLQTANAALLKKIGRIHTKEDFLCAVNNALSAGITNINADLMYALPWQTAEEVRETIDFLRDLPLNHVSAYALKIEEGTPFYRSFEKGEFDLPDEDLDREMFYMIADDLTNRGFSRYEISNFAKEGYECRHNLKYWELEDYIGLGVSAHSFYRGERFSNLDSLEDYIKDPLHAEITREKEPDLLFEELMLSLRIKKGLRLSIFKEDAQKPIKRLMENGLAEIKNDRLILTDHGMDLENSIIVLLSDFI